MLKKKKKKTAEKISHTTNLSSQLVVMNNIPKEGKIEIDWWKTSLILLLIILV